MQNILCAICQDIMLETCNGLFSTPCGHVFHQTCILKSLETSNRCPECRREVKKDRLIRLHVNFEENEAVKSKISDLDSQVVLQETELNKFRDENSKLQQQVRNVEGEIKSFKAVATSEVNSLRNENFNLTEQVQDLERKLKSLEAVNTFNKSFIHKSKLEKYRLHKLCQNYKEILERFKSQEIERAPHLVATMKLKEEKRKIISDFRKSVVKKVLNKCD